MISFCNYFRLLGEPCDSRLLLEHYGKHHYSQPEPQLDLDFKSESAAIYVLVKLQGSVGFQSNLNPPNFKSQFYHSLIPGFYFIKISTLNNFLAPFFLSPHPASLLPISCFVKSEISGKLFIMELFYARQSRLYELYFSGER